MWTVLAFECMVNKGLPLVDMIQNINHYVVSVGQTMTFDFRKAKNNCF